MSIGLAFRAFFATLSNREMAQKIQRLFEPDRANLETPGKTDVSAKGTVAGANLPAAASSKADTPLRSDALTLLSTLQREARFLDLVSESLDSYSDSQVGAAAREVIRDCRKSLDRIFAIVPLDGREEGSMCKIEQTSAVRTRIIGKPAGEGESGIITHRGWRASHCALPQWTGSAEDQWVLAPVEIEVGSHANR